MSFQHWPILAKSLSLLVLLGLVSILATVFTTDAMRTINNRYNAIISGPEKAILSSARANRAIATMSRDLLTMIMATDDSGVRSAEAQVGESKAAFIKNMDGAIAADPDHAQDYGQFKTQVLNALETACADTIRYGHSIQAADIAKAAELMKQDCQPLLNSASQDLIHFNDGRISDLDRQSADAISRTGSTIATTYAAVLGGLAVTLVVGVWLVLTGIVRRVKTLTGVMTGMSRGQLAASVPGQERKDELGAMARAAEIFRKGLEEAELLRAQAATQKEQAEAQRREMMLRLANEFENSVGGVADQVSTAATQLQAAAQQLTAAAQQTSSQSMAVSASAEEAGSNVTSVAASAEELGSSVAEIGRQVTTSANISTSAVKEADAAAGIFTELDEVAMSIGGVVDLIAGLAGQTNLLALNATIESARAGEAGKGFAVVASEVKQLAAQTAKATTEISAKIGQIQAATAKAVGAIRNITGTIQTISETSSAIATAVDQQAAATQEIVHAVHQASIGTHDVTANIAGVAQAADQTGAAASQVLASSGDLASQAARLQHEMASFLETVRAA